MNWKALLVVLGLAEGFRSERCYFSDRQDLAQCKHAIEYNAQQLCLGKGENSRAGLKVAKSKFGYTNVKRLAKTSGAGWWEYFFKLEEKDYPHESLMILKTRHYGWAYTAIGVGFLWFLAGIGVLISLCTPYCCRGCVKRRRTNKWVSVGLFGFLSFFGILGIWMCTWYAGYVQADTKGSGCLAGTITRDVIFERSVASSIPDVSFDGAYNMLKLLDGFEASNEALRTSMPIEGKVFVNATLYNAWAPMLWSNAFIRDQSYDMTDLGVGWGDPVGPLIHSWMEEPVQNSSRLLQAGSSSWRVGFYLPFAELFEQTLKKDTKFEELAANITNSISNQSLDGRSQIDVLEGVISDVRGSMRDAITQTSDSYDATLSVFDEIDAYGRLSGVQAFLILWGLMGIVTLTVGALLFWRYYSAKEYRQDLGPNDISKGWLATAIFLIVYIWLFGSFTLLLAGTILGAGYMPSDMCLLMDDLFENGGYDRFIEMDTRWADTCATRGGDGRIISAYLNQQFTLPSLVKDIETKVQDLVAKLPTPPQDVPFDPDSALPKLIQSWTDLPVGLTLPDARGGDPTKYVDGAFLMTTYPDDTTIDCDKNKPLCDTINAHSASPALSKSAVLPGYRKVIGAINTLFDSETIGCDFQFCAAHDEQCIAGTLPESGGKFPLAITASLVPHGTVPDSDTGLSESWARTYFGGEPWRSILFRAMECIRPTKEIPRVKILNTLKLLAHQSLLFTTLQRNHQLVPELSGLMDPCPAGQACHLFFTVQPSKSVYLPKLIPGTQFQNTIKSDLKFLQNINSTGIVTVGTSAAPRNNAFTQLALGYSEAESQYNCKPVFESIDKVRGKICENLLADLVSIGWAWLLLGTLYLVAWFMVLFYWYSRRQILRQRRPEAGTDRDSIFVQTADLPQGEPVNDRESIVVQTTAAAAPSSQAPAESAPGQVSAEPAPAQSPALAPAQSPALAPTQSPALAPAQSPALAPTQPPALAPTQSPAPPALAQTQSPAPPTQGPASPEVGAGDATGEPPNEAK